MLKLLQTLYEYRYMHQGKDHHSPILALTGRTTTPQFLPSIPLPQWETQVNWFQCMVPTFTHSFWPAHFHTQSQVDMDANNLMMSFTNCDGCYHPNHCVVHLHVVRTVWFREACVPRCGVSGAHSHSGQE